MVQNVSGWIVMGLIAGFMAGKLLNKHGQSGAMEMVFGTIGAVAGGWFFVAIGSDDPVSPNVGSLLVALVGAVIFVLIGRGVRNSASRMWDVLSLLRPF